MRGECMSSQAIEMDPSDAELYAGRAQALIREEQYVEAVQDAGKATELDPKLAKAHLRKG